MTVQINGPAVTGGVTRGILEAMTGGTQAALAALKTIGLPDEASTKSRAPGRAACSGVRTGLVTPRLRTVVA